MTSEPGWAEDPEFWATLDQASVDAWPSLKQFLDVTFEHQHELPLVSQALLFGILGGFVKSYVEARAELNEPPEALEMAMAAVMQDRRVQQMMKGGIDQTIDRKVEGMAND